MNEAKIQLWDAAALRENLWPENCRPSMRWIREQTRRRAIPSIKWGRLVWYNPDQVRAAIEKRTVNARGGGK
jgi:hypothetical protein